MAERKLTLKEIVDKVYIDLPEDENISEDEPSSENEYFSDDDCTNDYNGQHTNFCHRYYIDFRVYQVRRF